jgi:CheY-like chemotaxis protein
VSGSTGPRILIVDDMPDTRRLMRRVLEMAGMSVIEAGSGEAALEQIGTARPALVVLDLRLPGMSGLDVARWVRAHADRAVAETILLACSASVQPEIQREALHAGCDAFEGKPFDIRVFATTIRGLIESPPKDRLVGSTG